MSRSRPTIVPSRPVLDLLSAVLLAAALCAAPSAHALNRVAPPGFEPSFTSDGWTATAKTGDAIELAFAALPAYPLPLGTLTPYEGSLTWVGTWTATANKQEASRTLTQTFIPDAPVNARLRGFYQRFGTGNVRSATLAFTLNDAAGTVLHTFEYATTGEATNDIGWQNTGWSPTLALAAGVTYTVEIRWAVWLDNGAAQGAAVDLVELQVSPAGLAATLSPGSVTLGWQPSAGGSPVLRASNPYSVYRRTSTGSRTLLGSAASPSYTDGSAAAPLDPNAVYVYDATDFDGGNAESPPSPELSVRTLPAAPGTPSFASVTETGLTVNWTAPTGGAVSYVLDRAPDAAGAPGSFAQVAAGLTGTNHPDSGLTCSTTYWYRVRATNASGDGPWSAAASQRTLDCPALTVGDSAANPAEATKCPHETTAQQVDAFTLQTNKGTDTVTSVTLTFGAGNIAALSRVEITNSGGTPLCELDLLAADVPSGDVITVPECNLTAVSGAATVYRVRVLPKGHADMPAAEVAVTAYVSAVQSGYAERTYQDATGGPITFDNLPPAAPAWVLAAAADAQASLEWTAVSDANLYLVLRGPSAVTAAPEENTTYAVNATLGDATVRHWSANTSLNDTGLANASAYHYRLAARDSCGNWSSGIHAGPLVPRGTVTVGNGNDPGDASICPGDLARPLDGFSLKVSNGTDTVDSVSVTFPAGVVAGLSQVEITDNAGGVVYGLSTTLADTTLVNLASPIDVTTATVNYRVRITPKTQATMPSPGARYDLSAQVTAVSCFSDTLLQDIDSASVALDDEAPAAAVLNANLLDSRIDLSWSNTGTGVVLLRDTAPLTDFVPAEGSTYSTGDTFGSARVVYAGTNTSYGDTSAVNGTTYHYALFAYDGCKNYSPVGTSGPHTPKGTTTVGDGTDPGNANLCPGDAAKMLDAFSLKTSLDADTVTSVTVDFAAGTAEGLALVEITNSTGSVVHGSTATLSGSTTVSLSDPIAVSTTATQYRVRVTPKSAAAMPPSPGVRYQITCKVTAVACANDKAYNDTDSATLTLDNESPATPAWGTLTDGDGQIDLRWSFTGAGVSVLVLRGPAAISDGPAEGSTYVVGNPVGAATVVYVGTGTSLTDTDVVNGRTYHYAIYAYDGCRNYSPGAPSGPRVPSAATTTIGDGAQLPDVSLCPGASPAAVDAFTLQTTRGTDQITELTVKLADGTAPLVGRVEVTSDDEATVYGGADAPAADLVPLTLGTALQAGTTPTQFRIRLAPKGQQALSAPPGSVLQLGATLDGLVSGNLVVGSDPTGAVARVDNLAPEAVAWGEVVPLDSTLSLAWIAPEDSEQVLVLRAQAEIDGAPADGSNYMVGATLGNAAVVYVGDGVGFSDIGLTEGTEYWYAAFARDACGNWSLSEQVGPIVPGEPVTTLGDGFDPPDDDLCPGAAAQPIDAFTLKTSWGVDQVTELTLVLNPGTAEAISLLEVTSADGATVYGSVSSPDADVLALTLDSPLAVGSAPTTYSIRVTPRDHAELPAPPGALYELSCKVAYFTANNAEAGADTGATLFLDNASPAAPEFLPALDENGQVTLGWSGPQESGLDGYLLVRGAGELPQEGESHQAGDPLGGSVVVYAGAGTTWSEPRPADDETVYRLFARDRCGNWSVPAEQKPLEPSTDGGQPSTDGGEPAADGGGPQLGAYDLGGCGCTQGAAPLAALAAIFSLAVLRRRREE